MVKMFKQFVKATSTGLLLSTLINFALFGSEENEFLGKSNSEIGYEIKDLIVKHGYKFENHTVRTEDGYLLELHRIPHPLQGQNRTQRPVALLVHGIFVTSAVWVLDGPQKALAYKLSDSGYDVWMANCRGNKFSRKHIVLDPYRNAEQFFDYSWHQIGFYDLPATIQYISNATGSPRMTYMGHSQGCTSLFVMLSERPQFNGFIEKMVAMAPVVYTKKASCTGFLIARKFQKILEWVLDFFKMHQFLDGNILGHYSISRVLCSENSFFQGFCKWHYSIIGGNNPEQVNTSNLDMIYEHFPTGSSTKQFLHFLQISESDIFRQYDFGKVKNLLKYSQETPPEYNFSNINVPIDLYYGNNDFFSSEEDVLKLHKKLPNVRSKTKVSDLHFTHFNFMFGKSTHKVLYEDIIHRLQVFT